MTNNYLLVDFGNSYIKAAIYDLFKDKILEIAQVPNKQSASQLFKKFKKINKVKFNDIVISATPGLNIVKPFCKQAEKMLNAKSHLVGKTDFEDLIDLSNINKDVFIGADIYCCVLKQIKTFGSTPSVVVSLGTAYFATVVENKQIKSAYLLPSLTNAMKMIEKLTNIPHEQIPNLYDKTTGRNTLSSFASGANLCIEGFVDKIVEFNNVKPKNVILTGGDNFRYLNINKKYKEVKNYVLLGLVELVKEKMIFKKS